MAKSVKKKIIATVANSVADVSQVATGKRNRTRTKAKRNVAKSHRPIQERLNSDRFESPSSKRGRERGDTPPSANQPKSKKTNANKPLPSASTKQLPGNADAGKATPSVNSLTDHICSRG